MRFSNFFIPTLKETPKDVVLKSHEYLLRGGFIQQIGSGIYNFLPLGKRVLEKFFGVHIVSLVKRYNPNRQAHLLRELNTSVLLHLYRRELMGIHNPY